MKHTLTLFTVLLFAPLAALHADDLSEPTARPNVLFISMDDLNDWVEPLGGQYADWKHSGSIYVLTTPEGANLPASASVKDFPLLVRLHLDHFRFSETEEDGSDIRFSAGATPLSYLATKQKA